MPRPKNAVNWCTALQARSVQWSGRTEALATSRASSVAPSEAGEGEISPMSFLRALRRRAALALVVALLAAGVAGAAACFVVPSSSYTAEARLLVAAQTPKVLFPTADDAGNDYYRFQRTQMTLIRDRWVLRGGADPKVANCRMLLKQVDPLQWLADKLKVEFVDGGEVMEISLAGDDPQELVSIVNAVKKSYMDEVVNVDAKRRRARHDYLKKLRQTYADRLKVKRETMRKKAETIGSEDRQAQSPGATVRDGTPELPSDRAPRRPIAKAEDRGPAQSDGARSRGRVRGSAAPLPSRGRSTRRAAPGYRRAGR